MLNRFKWITSLVLAVILMGTTPIMAAPTVFMDGIQLSFDVPPVIENDRTLVPMAAIFTALGAEVSWDGDTYTVTAVKTDTTIVLQIGNTTAYKNGQPIVLDVPPKTINDRTMVPLAFVGNALGANVSWEEATQSIYITASSGQQIKVHFIDVGQADSIYIQLPDHKDILIDGGNVGDGTTVVNYLKAQGVDDIELMIATHPHEDHIGGLPAVLGAFQVDEIIDSGKTATTKIYSTYSATAQAEGCTWLADNHQSLTFGNVALQILTGPETWQEVNDYSVVTRLTDGNIHFLFEGDAQADAEAALQGDISAQVLKVGHHGSSTSSSPSFLSRVHPQAAIISVGAGNTYGHPTQATLAKLQAAGSTIYRTDLNGNIVITTDGVTYTVATDKSLPAPTAPVITLVPTTPAQSAGVYVGSIKSDKYHYPSCTYARKILAENQIWFASEAEALAAGYAPCGVCKP